MRKLEKINRSLFFSKRLFTEVHFFSINAEENPSPTIYTRVRVFAIYTECAHLQSTQSERVKKVIEFYQSSKTFVKQYTPTIFPLNHKIFKEFTVPDALDSTRDYKLGGENRFNCGQAHGFLFGFEIAWHIKKHTKRIQSQVNDIGWCAK